MSNTNDDKFTKKSINSKQYNKKSERNTPPKKLKTSTKCDLKQYLTFSGTKIPETSNIQQNIKAQYSTNNEKSYSHRINSESSITNILNINKVNGSNKNIVLEAMKSLKFQKSSIDHQKYSLERLSKSKSSLFCLLVIFDSSNKFYVRIL